MKLVVADRDGVFTFEAGDASREIVYIGDTAIVLGPEDEAKDWDWDEEL